MQRMDYQGVRCVCVFHTQRVCERRWVCSNVKKDVEIWEGNSVCFVDYINPQKVIMSINCGCDVRRVVFRWRNEVW